MGFERGVGDLEVWVWGIGGAHSSGEKKDLGLMTGISVRTRGGERELGRPEEEEEVGRGEVGKEFEMMG